jgi:CheY-like chemotaxis protein
MKLDFAPTTVVTLCQSSLTFIKQQALKKRIQVEIRLSPNLPDLLVDERRVRQVLINLLNNAVKFTPEGGHITLFVNRRWVIPPQLQGVTWVTSYRAVDKEKLILESQHQVEKSMEYLRISIIDTGIGIASEHMDRLFQPFVQIDSALNRQYTGTGLGLALVKRIVELHGGEVGLASQVGEGSCFMISLPCTPAVTSSPKLDTQPEIILEAIQPKPGSFPLILLAEDNEANISTISNYLTAKGYRVLTAKTGQEAIALAQSEHPDLVLMDIQMPGMDGLEAIQQIRRDRNLVNVPIIALTALAMTNDRDRCLAAGANDYLAKPIKLKQLAATIQQLLTAQ